ncbi:flagellar basal-body MS-ring/collar protein FliF [Cellulomonas sp. ATA003]|uniref:flagellar basal-body MS-ring/collar protein FliF n=1 Tax=Cellulomonas sp. ATA003 TaxID=3073064 RepID=UPI002873B8F2|nr:flagellar basal-body MS-ring/collar protein FliF [Cellulomonas sp. ATA003]WNB85242.1 flagellar basal-body MS-ring/collar protein FliF [Cellulomonas sp. ATA003]
MPAQLTSAVERLKAVVAQFTLAQRTLALIGVAGLVLGLIALSSWMTKPTMSPLFSGVSAADASAIVDQLNGEGVPYELADGGSTILVPADKLYATRLSVAAAGLPASSDGGGYSLLDDMGMTASEFQQQVTYQRAMEGELSKTIGAIKGVEAATVKLAMPEETVFVAEKADPTASVFVQTKQGVTLESGQVQSIVHLVSSGIQGMSPTDVAVIDAQGRVLSAIGGAAGSGLSDQQTGEYEQRVSASVQAMLDRLVGPGKAVVAVNAELNYDNTDRTSETFDATEGVPPLSSSTTREEYTGTGGTPVGGVLGPDNIAVPGGAGNADGTYLKESEVTNPAVNKVTERTTTAPGSVERQSVSVVVDAAAGGALNMVELEGLVAAAAGIDAARGDTVQVSRMVFDTQTADAAQEALAIAAAEEKAAEQAELIRSAAIAGGIVLLLLVMAIMAKRRSSRARREALDLGELQVVDTTPRLPFDDDDAVLALPAPEPTVDEAAIRRAEIGALAEEQPGEVADLLRGWLVEGGKR